MDERENVEIVEDAVKQSDSGGISKELLQEIVDAIPDALVVIDTDFNIVLANQVARWDGGSPMSPKCTKCYRCLHHRDSPCTDEEGFVERHGPCPTRQVLEKKTTVFVHHTHYEENEREISVAVVAAPIFDESGAVRLIIETCRDVTERSFSSRLLRIGNRHMEMAPSLEEYTAEIRRFTGCADAGIHVLNKECDACAVVNRRGCINANERCCNLNESYVCLRSLTRHLPSDVSMTSNGSIRFDRFSGFLDELSAARRAGLDAECLQGCESVALIPIRCGDMNVGVLHVADVRPNVISAELVASLERLSLEVGTAIHRVRIEEALRDARDQLEVRIAERTEQLMKMNATLQREINEKVRLEREILQVGVREQQRIGQELHDGIGQELTGLGYLAQNLFLKLKAQGSSEADTAEELARDIPETLGQIQKIVRGLVPLEVGARDLEIALDVLTSNVTKLVGIQCEFSCTGCDLIADDDAAIQIYRIAQEAITNAVKHAQAEHVNVSLRVCRDRIQLEVCDDGIGIRDDAEDGPGCGLRSMRYRARAVDGECEIRRRSCGGTLVTCVFPGVLSNVSAAEPSGNESQNTDR